MAELTFGALKANDKYYNIDSSNSGVSSVNPGLATTELPATPSEAVQVVPPGTQPAQTPVVEPPVEPEPKPVVEPEDEDVEDDVEETDEDIEEEEENPI